MPTEWSWNEFTDCVVFASCIIMIIFLLIDIFEPSKQRYTMTDKYDRLSKEHNHLSDEHNRLKEDNKYIVNNAKELLSREHKEILDYHKRTLGKVDIIETELNKSEERYKKLNRKQKNIKEHVMAIYDLMHEVEMLQEENIKLREQIAELNQNINKTIELEQNNTNGILPSQLPDNNGGITFE